MPSIRQVKSISFNRFRRIVQYTALKLIYSACIPFFLFYPSLLAQNRIVVQYILIPTRLRLGSVTRVVSQESGRESIRRFILLRILSLYTFRVIQVGILSSIVQGSIKSLSILTPASYSSVQLSEFYLRAPNPPPPLISRQYYRFVTSVLALVISSRIQITFDLFGLYVLNIFRYSVYQQPTQSGTKCTQKENTYIYGLSTTSYRIFPTKQKRIMSRLSDTYSSLSFNTACAIVVAIPALIILLMSIYPIPPLFRSIYTQKSFLSVFPFASQTSRQYAFSSFVLTLLGIRIKRRTYLGSDIISELAISTRPLIDRQNLAYTLPTLVNLLIIFSQKRFSYYMFRILTGTPRCLYRSLSKTTFISRRQTVGGLLILNRYNFVRLTFAPVALLYISSSSITASTSAQFRSIIAVSSANISVLIQRPPVRIPLICLSQITSYTSPSIIATNSRQLIRSPYRTLYRTQITSLRQPLIKALIFASLYNVLSQVIKVSSTPIFDRIAYIKLQSTRLQAFSQSRKRIQHPPYLAGGSSCPFALYLVKYIKITAQTARTLLSISRPGRKAY